MNENYVNIIHVVFTIVNFYLLYLLYKKNKENDDLKEVIYNNEKTISELGVKAEHFEELSEVYFKNWTKELNMTVENAKAKEAKKKDNDGNSNMSL